jgi:preprotein translocase subunit SecA
MQQAIETKEGCPVTIPQHTVAQISYQEFFRRYVHLSGMTGTTKEVRSELRSTYDLRTVRIPSRKPSRRQTIRKRILATQVEKWDYVVSYVQKNSKKGRPVLVGTRSIADSELLHEKLQACGVESVLLNARQNEDEAAIIAQAGQRGSVTVATNMAGRGTDIVLGPGVIELGGLLVIATERHESRRVDRQLAGRCARQGDPGSWQEILSIEDGISIRYAPERMRTVAGNARLQGVRNLLLRYAQMKAERYDRRIRAIVLRLDERLQTSLSFSGQPE